MWTKVDTHASKQGHMWIEVNPITSKQGSTWILPLPGEQVNAEMLTINTTETCIASTEQHRIYTYRRCHQLTLECQ